MMEARAFDDHLHRFGGDLNRWPAELAAEADALLAISPEARRAKAGMDELEQWLRAGSRKASNQDAAGDVSTTAAVAMRQRQLGPARPARRAATWGATWGAAAAAALALGVLVGNIAAPIDMHEDSPDQLVASALGATGSADVE